ncbi:MAG: carbohydrate porin [Bacteroidetes bacterium]|nr:MAG: carbohydrate porin [Bacteroidota bacterium]
MQLLLSLLTSISPGLKRDNDSLPNEKVFSIHAQTTIVNQHKLPFRAPYSGPNSLSLERENRISVTSTFYIGSRLWRNGFVFINPEAAGGEGLSQTLGLGGATNGETFRVDNPKPTLYLARLFFQQVFPLDPQGPKILNRDIDHFKDDDFNQVASYFPDRYVNIVVGKISIADYFDDNSFCHDPRTEFLNWALMASAAWDYPANTRGYTPSAVVELFTPRYECRAGISMVPTTANGSIMDINIGKAYGLTFEQVWNYKLLKNRGTTRLLLFYNTARMGSYTEALLQDVYPPDITLTRKYGRNKYGIALNIEQYISKGSGLFLRLSWNDGKNETWAFTEIDHAMACGLSLQGILPNLKDRWAIAYSLNGLSRYHRAYLQKGGKGFMLGDGNLNYGPEQIIESFYRFPLRQELFHITLDYQLILNPGYNRDRKGPVHVFSVRTHVRI